MMGKEWENYAAQAGMVATIGPTNDRLTSEFLSEKSGTTGMWVESRSSGDSMGQDGRMNMNDGLNYAQAERRFILPQELRHIPRGHGRIWTPGLGDRSIPFFAPNYWKRGELKGLVDPNPYRPA
jgi:type IV secretory pathway TraG/TraD family ATPase VirD4